MLHILYPPGMNWFYEALAQDLREDLALAGVESVLVTPAEFLEYQAGRGEGHDLLIVSLYECCHWLHSAAAEGSAASDVQARMRNILGNFQRRICVNLDCLHSSWFRAQIDLAGGKATDILDLCMAPQSVESKIAGCRYIWLPECFTARELAGLSMRRGARRIPWTMIGHVTSQRCELMDVLNSKISECGFVFLPGLRPYGGEGGRNLSREALQRVLRETDYYVWTSHHRFPYHEGCRALHALQSGAIPVKIDPLFGDQFRQIPWVYETVEEFARAADAKGPQRLFEEAQKFALSHGTLGERVAEALYGPSQRSSLAAVDQQDKAKDCMNERVAAT